MSRQRRRDTDAEMALRRALHALGYRYLVDAALPGMPRRRADLLFRGKRVAVFADGCYWHGCPTHRTFPRHNAAWWNAKIEANIARDGNTNRHLESQSWRVVRIWEHEPLTDAIERVVRALDGEPDY